MRKHHHHTASGHYLSCPDNDICYGKFVNKYIHTPYQFGPADHDHDKPTTDVHDGLANGIRVSYFPADLVAAPVITDYDEPTYPNNPISEAVGVIEHVHDWQPVGVGNRCTICGQWAGAVIPKTYPADST